MSGRRQGIGIAEVKAQMQARSREFVDLLLADLNPKKSGGYYQCKSPLFLHKDNEGMTVWVSGAVLSWRDHRAQAKGDAIDLIIHVGKADDRKGALAWAKGHLGIGDKVSDADRSRLQKEAEAAAAREAQREAEETARKVAYAKAIWLNGKPMQRGDAAWNYLTAARGIDVGQLRTLGSGLNALTCGLVDYHWPPAEDLKPEWVRKRPSSGTSKHPAMLCAGSPVLGKDGTYQKAHGGVHVTYLRGDGLGKADVPSPKKMFGRWGGCAMKLWRGETGLSDGKAAKKGMMSKLILTEGVEDALSVALAVPEARAWPVGSLAQLNSLPYPACTDDLIVCADNDWDKPAAMEALERAVARLRRAGPVSVARSPVGKDMNDCLQGKG